MNDLLLSLLVLLGAGGPGWFPVVPVDEVPPEVPAERPPLEEVAPSEVLEMLANAEPAGVPGLPEVVEAYYPSSLTAALRTALDLRSEIREAELEFRRREAIVGEAAGELLPKVNASIGARKIRVFDEFLKDVEIESKVESRFGQLEDLRFEFEIDRVAAQYQADLGVDARWNLFAGGADWSRVQGARAGSMQARAERAAVKRAVLLDAAGAFVAARKAQIRLRSGLRSVGLAEGRSRLARKSFEAGEISELEFRAMRLGLAEARAGARRAEIELAAQRAAYANSLGLDPVSVPLPPLRVDLAGLEDLLPSATAPHPAIESGRAAREVASSERSVVGAEFLPRIGLLARYSLVEQDRRGLERAFSELGNDVYVLGLQLQWNLFNGFQSLFRQRRAVAAESAAALALARTERDLSAHLREAQARVEQLEIEVELGRERIALERARMKVDEVRVELEDLAQTDREASLARVAEAEAALELLELDLLQARLAARLLPR